MNPELTNLRVNENAFYLLLTHESYPLTTYRTCCNTVEQFHLKTLSIDVGFTEVDIALMY